MAYVEIIHPSLITGWDVFCSIEKEEKQIDQDRYPDKL